MSIRAGPPNACTANCKSQNALLVCVNQDPQASSVDIQSCNLMLPVTSGTFNPPLPKMAKRKMENRSFQERWEADYLFVNVKDRLVCLVYGANVAVCLVYGANVAVVLCMEPTWL